MTSTPKRTPARERAPREHYPDDTWRETVRVLVIRDPSVKAEARTLLLALYLGANEAGATWVSKETLRAEVDREPKSFARDVSHLIDAGKVLYAEGFTAEQSAELCLDLRPKPSAHGCGWLIVELAAAGLVDAWRARIGAHPAAVRSIVLPVAARSSAPSSPARTPPPAKPPAPDADATLRALEALLSPSDWAAEGDVMLRAEASARIDRAANGRAGWLRHMADAIRDKARTWPRMAVTTPSVAWLAGGRRGSDPRTWAPMGQALGAAERRWKAERDAAEAKRHEAAQRTAAEAEAKRRDAAEQAKREREAAECTELRAELRAVGIEPLPEPPGGQYTFADLQARDVRLHAWCKAIGVPFAGADSEMMRKALDAHRKEQAGAAQRAQLGAATSADERAQRARAAMATDMGRSPPADDTPFEGPEDPLSALSAMFTRKLG